MDSPALACCIAAMILLFVPLGGFGNRILQNILHIGAKPQNHLSYWSYSSQKYIV
jgi:hypothetical protein